MITRKSYPSRGERDNPTERSQSGSLRNSPSLSRDPTHSRTVRQGIPPRQEVAPETQHSSEDLFCDWCETSVATLHNIRGPDGIVKQVCPTCRDICVARARAAKEEESQRAYNLKRRKEELRSAMELKEYEITCEEEIARRRARSKDYDDSGSPKRRDEDSRAPVGRSKTQPVNGGNSSRPTNARGGKGGKGYVTGVSWPFEPSASRECEEEDQHEEDEDNDAEEENSDDDMGDESAKSVISQVSNKSGRNRFRLPRPDPPEDDLDSVFDAASLEDELLTMTKAEALDFKIKIANLKAIREQTGHHRQKSSDDKAQITRDEVAWGTSQTQAHEHYGRTALNKLKQPMTPPSAGEVAQALLDLWNHAYRLGKERYQTVSRYPLIIYMFSVFMRPISEWLHPLERTTSSSTSFVKKAYMTIPTKFINSLLEAWGFSSGTKIGQLEYLRISASVGTQTLQFEEIKQASEYVRSILYRLGDIWPFKKAMKDFKTCMFTQAYTSACHEPSQAVWIMVQWCREKSDLCRKAYAFTVQKYLHDYFAEVKNNRSRKTKTIILKGYHRYVSYVADQWRRKYTGTPRLQDIEALIDLKDSSPNAIGSEPSVLTIFIEELPDTEEWRALTFKVTGKAITTDDIYGSRPDNNQYSHLFQNVDAYFSWLLGVGREIEESSRLKARDHFSPSPSQSPGHSTSSQKTSRQVPHGHPSQVHQSPPQMVTAAVGFEARETSPECYPCGEDPENETAVERDGDDLHSAYAITQSIQQSLEPVMKASGVHAYKPQDIIPLDQWMRLCPNKPFPYTVTAIKYHLFQGLFGEYRGAWAKMIQHIVRNLWKTVRGEDDYQVQERDTWVRCDKVFPPNHHICPQAHTSSGCIQYHSQYPDSPLGKPLSTLAHLLSDDRLKEACAAYQENNGGKLCQGACAKQGPLRSFAQCTGTKMLYFEEVMPNRAGLLFTYVEDTVNASKTDIKWALINLALDLVHVYWASLAPTQRSLHGSSQ